MGAVTPVTMASGLAANIACATSSASVAASNPVLAPIIRHQPTEPSASAVVLTASKNSRGWTCPPP